MYNGEDSTKGRIHMATEKPSPKQLSGLKTALLALAASVLLILSNSALWFNKNIFDTNNFTNTATEALLSESSRTAIATGITDKALEGRPAIKSLVDDRAIKLISSILDTSQVRTGVDKTVRFLQTTITSQDPQPVSFDLSAAKQTISRVVTAIDERTDRPESERRINPEDIPDEIVLFDPSGLPNIYAIGTALLWIGPLALVLALVILGYIVYRASYDRLKSRNALLVVTATLVLTGLFAMIIGPLFRPPVLAQVPGPNLRIVTANVYDAFIATFTSQTDFLFVAAVLTALAALVLQLQPLYVARLSKSKVATTEPIPKSSKSRKKK